MTPLYMSHPEFTGLVIDPGIDLQRAAARTPEHERNGIRRNPVTQALNKGHPIWDSTFRLV